MTHITDDRQSSHPATSSRLGVACRDPRHQCALVLAANAGLVACAVAEPFGAALALHVALLAVNAWRLRLALQAGRLARPRSVAAASADIAATRQRVESMRCPAVDARAMTQTIRLSPRA